jgi:hypothetical protein
MCFLANPTRFADERSKVVFAGSYLSSVAQAWFEPFVFAEEGAASGLFRSFARFEEELTRMFGNPDEVASAERKIRALRMAEHHHASRYVTDFRRYSTLIAWNDAALASQFRTGLPDRILDELACRDDPITDLGELERVVLRLDARYWERRDERARQERTARTYPPGPPVLRDRPTDRFPTLTAALPRGPSTGPRQSTLTPEERTRCIRIRLGLCLVCGGVGHRVTTCPRRGTTRDRPPGRTPGRYGSTPEEPTRPMDTTPPEPSAGAAEDNAVTAADNTWMAENDPATQ